MNQLSDKNANWRPSNSMRPRLQLNLAISAIHRFGRLIQFVAAAALLSFSPTKSLTAGAPFKANGVRYADKVFSSPAEACAAYAENAGRNVASSPKYDGEGGFHCFIKSEGGSESDNVVVYVNCPAQASVQSMTTCVCEGSLVYSNGECREPDNVTSDAKGGAPAKSPQVEHSPGEPGRWAEDLTVGRNMTGDPARYQEQITKRSPSETYYVRGVSFDGYEPGEGGKQGTLLEAKHLGDEGRFAKAYERMNKGDFQDIHNLLQRTGNILDQARRQVLAADGTGARIEWRVSGEKAKQALQKAFDNDAALKGKITVVHKPLD